MSSLYEQVGGQPFFDTLVERFYEGVAADPLLRPMYPDDLTESKQHLALFLAQYWGGPDAYMLQRGHPRLRMRHAPFVVDQAASEAWLRHMAAAVLAADLDESLEQPLLDYFSHAAAFLINTD